MSSSNAAAKKRRAPPSVEPPPSIPGRQSPAQPNQPTNMSAGLTLPQVIAVIDKRLTNLETFMGETKQAETKQVTDVNIAQSLENLKSGETVGSSYLEEFNSRFEILADEIANMKNIVLSLQSYTMDVNKMLMDERIRILSEVTDEEVSGEKEDIAETKPVNDLSNHVVDTNTTILA
jgi:hypothetical protein